MRQGSISEKLLMKEVTKAALAARTATRGMHIGSLVKSIRKQLGMSQQVLAKRAKVPQPTISRIEKGERDCTLSILNKILEALFCELILIPLLKEPIDEIRRKQAATTAEMQVRYLKGTMNMENQQPDPHFIRELVKDEQQQLLNGPNAKLWQK